MSTLVAVVVVVVTIAGAMRLALRDPDQPATPRARKPRVSPPPSREQVRAPAPGRPPAGSGVGSGGSGGGSGGGRPDFLWPPAPPVATGAGAATFGVTLDGGGFTEGWAPIRRAPSVWLRLRSGVVLTFLLALLGTLLAASVASLIVLVALAVRSAVA